MGLIRFNLMLARFNELNGVFFLVTNCVENFSGVAYGEDVLGDQVVSEGAASDREEPHRQVGYRRDEAILQCQRPQYTTRTKN